MRYQLAYLLHHFGYFGIIIALLGGIIGLPIPDEVLLTYVGYQVYLGKMVYLTSLLCAFSGAVSGITLSYFLGIKLGLPFLQKFGPKVHISNEKIERTKNLFSRFGPYLLFFGYFIPGVRHLTAYLAGINSFSYKKFAIFAYPGALLWSFTFITLGRMLGENWRIVGFYMSKYRIFIIPAIIVLLAAFFYVFWRKKRSAAKPNEVYE